MELLYESQTTRVFRLAASPGVVCKEPLGADAQRRLHHEVRMLEQLAGVAGIAPFVPGFGRNGVIALRDSGGESLAQFLTQRSCDAMRIVKFATQLSRTLAEVHRRGVIHRDINPSNILVSEEGDAVLIDFDLAVPADPHAVAGQDGKMVGTLAYLAPEQTGRTGRTTDQRADLYALGVTLYEMATGKLPFEASETLDLIHQHMVREPVAPSKLDSHVPAGLSAIVMRLMAKAPEQRYQSAEGLHFDLQRLRSDLEEGGNGEFELGERDFPARLAPPRKLIGRDAELAMLRSAFAASFESQHRTVLIEGAAGVGKSALVNELRPMVAAAGGWFVHGKFDQFQKDAATAGAVTHAARALGRLLLALPRDELALERQRILDTLGRNAGLLTRLSPEIGMLIGAQPDVPEVDPRQAELQLQQAIVGMLAAVASPKRPLVVVLDDLQWAGAISLRGFGRLISESGLRGLLLVGAFRPGELGEDHALPPLLAQWRELAQPPLRIGLPNLPESVAGEMVGKMLRMPADRGSQLAHAMRTLTAGNPFDTVEMINALRDDGVLALDESGWQWDDAKVRHFVGGGNVVDLLATRVSRLPIASRELMEYMSFLGSSVECGLLFVAAGLRSGELEERLRAPVSDGLLVPETVAGMDTVRFRHDRVQQAVMATLDDARRTQLQFAMARRLANDAAFEDEAAQQYLACAASLDDPEEQGRAAGLFVKLAHKLAGTATYQLAERYLAAASNMLRQMGEPDAAMREAIDAARHAALYSLGRLQESDPLFDAMHERMTDPLEMLEPTCLQMRSLFMRGQTAQARQLGLGLLAQLGLEAPPHYTAPDSEERTQALADWVREDAKLDASKRAQITDARLLAIAKLLGRLARPAYFSADSKPFKWLLLESQRLWAEHGPCPELVASLGRISSMLITLRQDYRTAYEISRHVLAVGEAFGWEPQTSEARFIFCTFGGHWFERVEDVLRQFRRAGEGVRAAGDASYAGYVHAVLITNLLETAPDIDASIAEVESGHALCMRAGNVHAAAQHTCELQMLRALAGRTSAPHSFDDAQFNEQAFLARLGKLPYMEHTYAECRAMHGLIMGDMGVLLPNAVLGMSKAGDVAGYYMSVYAHFFYAMARAWQLHRDESAADCASLLAEVESCRTWLAARAADQPANFAHLAKLVEAEQAWVQKDLWKAAAAFDAAQADAARTQRPWHRAVITERAGLFHLDNGLANAGRRLLADARNQFAAWGATAKVIAMESAHEFLRIEEPEILLPTEGVGTRSNRRSTTGVSSDALDLMGVLRASQALSSETNMGQLTTRVTEVLAALTGATRVHVLAWIRNQWMLLAPSAGESPIPLAEAGDAGMLPLSVFSYAERTGEALVLDDALADDRFERDPYFASHDQCSVLVVPIASQGATRAMLYLENSQGPSAFNAQRLDAVTLVAGQLAVSLANAQLYESLEQRVHERTRELEDMQARLVDTARRAGKAEIANNVLHNVGNVLNSINVSASMVRRTIDNSRLAGLTRVIDLMKKHESDLPAFVENDERGKALLAYMNELAGALQQEQSEALNDLDRVVRSVDHISHVVSAQQSHAGPSSLREAIRPQQIFEEALRLSGEAIMGTGVHVVMQVDAAAAIALDKPRLLQVLVNLIANAAQAMSEVPAEARQLTLAARMFNEEGIDWLRITAQDTGEGIAADHLTQIFSHGFSARKGGHGFGLHSSALAAMEMGGRLTAQSDGPGQGATFTLEVPVGE